MRTGSPLEWIEETASGAEYLVLEAEGELPYGFEILFDLTGRAIHLGEVDE
ncbi:MAG: hypothetical protein SV760_04615 [Halobacteria archaeon]|nr:hypothetical protein [Halobacteria archaeon]